MKNLKNIVRDFPKAKILVIGDLILDEYILGEVERISPEAPVPVVWAKRHAFVPGGAANVANNICALDGKVTLAGVVGKDKNADILISELKKRGINTSGIFTEPKRKTTVKTRIVAGHQQVVRVDWEDVEPLGQGLNHKLINFLKSKIGNFDAVVIEDYGKGVINQESIKNIIALARARRKIVNIDPKEDHFQYYRGVTSITPNRKELENAIKNLKIKDTLNKFKLSDYRLSVDKEINLAAGYILKYLSLDSLLLTLGEHGMRLFEKGKRMTHIPTVAQEVFDVSGAGDTVIATFTLGLCCRADKLEAAHLANFAAGIVVGKAGTAVITREELLKVLP